MITTKITIPVTILTSTPVHDNVLLILWTCFSYVNYICCFQCSSCMMDYDWLIDSNVFLLCRYHYSYGANFPILTELEPLLNIYNYSYHLWCDLVFRFYDFQLKYEVPLCSLLLYKIKMPQFVKVKDFHHVHAVNNHLIACSV